MYQIQKKILLLIFVKDNVTKEEVTINEDELVDYINMNM